MHDIVANNGWPKWFGQWLPLMATDKLCLWHCYNEYYAGTQHCRGFLMSHVVGANKAVELGAGTVAEHGAAHPRTQQV